MSDQVKNAPPNLGALAGLAGITLTCLGLVWNGATQLTEIRGEFRQLRVEVEAARASGREQREQLGRRTAEQHQAQQAEIDMLRRDAATQAALTAEVRATMLAMKTSLDRIEQRLFDPQRSSR